MQANLYDIHGKETGTIDLEDSHFGIVPNLGLIHRLLILQQANGRIAIAHTKGRGEIRGSTRKLYRQKGTGKARVGSKNSPTRRGGGVAFGPKSEQNWEISMNKKERRLALLSLLSTKAQKQQIKVLENVEQKSSKTKDMVNLFTTLGVKKAVVAVTHEDSQKMVGARNIPTVKVLNVEYLNPHDLLKYDNLLFTKSSLDHLYSHFA